MLSAFHQERRSNNATGKGAFCGRHLPSDPRALHRLDEHAPKVPRGDHLRVLGARVRRTLAGGRAAPRGISLAAELATKTLAWLQAELSSSYHEMALALARIHGECYNLM